LLQSTRPARGWKSRFAAVAIAARKSSRRSKSNNAPYITHGSCRWWKKTYFIWSLPQNISAHSM
jgi:hypothetical protein